MIRKLLLPLLVLAAVAAWQRLAPPSGAAATASAETAAPAAGNVALEAAIDQQARDVQISGSGTVLKLLPDDEDGSRHQRFLLRLDSGRTLLVAHNIDLAPRLEPLQRGDVVSFHGEYVWNAKGGVVHWTHRDPRGRHPGGWLQHGEQRVQ